MLSLTSAWVQRLDSKLRSWKRRKVRKSTSKYGHQRCGTASHYRQLVYSCLKTVPSLTISLSPTRSITLARQAYYQLLYNQSQKYHQQLLQSKQYHLKPQRCSRCLNSDHQVSSRSIMQMASLQGVQLPKIMKRE